MSGAIPSPYSKPAPDGLSIDDSILYTNYIITRAADIASSWLLNSIPCNNIEKTFSVMNGNLRAYDMKTRYISMNGISRSFKINVLPNWEFILNMTIEYDVDVRNDYETKEYCRKHAGMTYYPGRNTGIINNNAIARILDMPKEDAKNAIYSAPYAKMDFYASYIPAHRQFEEEHAVIKESERVFFSYVYDKIDYMRNRYLEDYRDDTFYYDVDDNSKGIAETMSKDFVYIYDHPYMAIIRDTHYVNFNRNPISEEDCRKRAEEDAANRKMRQTIIDEINDELSKFIFEKYVKRVFPEGILLYCDDVNACQANILFDPEKHPELNLSFRNNRGEKVIIRNEIPIEWFISDSENRADYDYDDESNKEFNALANELNKKAMDHYLISKTPLMMRDGPTFHITPILKDGIDRKKIVEKIIDAYSDECTFRIYDAETD